MNNGIEILYWCMAGLAVAAAILGFAAALIGLKIALDIFKK
jgi:hypothetical protein